MENYKEKYLKYKIKYNELINGEDIILNPILPKDTKHSLQQDYTILYPKLKMIEDRPLEYRFMILYYKLRKYGGLIPIQKEEYNNLKKILFKRYVLHKNELSQVLIDYFEDDFKSYFFEEILTNLYPIHIEQNLTQEEKEQIIQKNKLIDKFKKLSDDKKYEFFLYDVKLLYNIETEIKTKTHMINYYIDLLEKITNETNKKEYLELIENLNVEINILKEKQNKIINIFKLFNLYQLL